MADGGQNPDEPPLKGLKEQEGERTEEQRRSPDINVDVKGSEKSTIGTSTVIGLVYGDVGATYGRSKAEGGQNPDEPPAKKPRKLEPNETKEYRQAIATGPKDSTVGTSLVIGHVSGDVTYRHDHQKELLESTRRVISIRTKGMIHVSTVDVLLDKLKNGNKWITITGNAGDGKTTLGHLVLRKFINKMKVFVIETPEDYDQISKITEDRVILLNDIFGAFTFDSTSVNKWRKVVTDIFDIQIKRPDIVTKVLFVSRKSILQEAKDHLEQYGQEITDEQNWFDVSQDMKEKERLQILEYHLGSKNITISDWDKHKVINMDTAHGFPHCCKMFAELVSKDHNIEIVDFFKSPLKFLDKTTKLLFETDYRELFITLVKNDGKFSTDSVEDDDKRWNLEGKAQLQEGSYLANFEGFWVFRHPSIYESVLSVVAKKDPLLFVRHASMSVLQQKARIKTSASDTTICYILLEPKPRVLDALSDRFIELLQNGDYEALFRHSFSRNEEFFETLIRKYIHKECELINRNDSTGYGMLHHAAITSNNIAIKSLLKHGADVNLGDKWNISCLSNVFETSDIHWQFQTSKLSVETLQLLITSGADINHVDDEGKTPLHRLCENWNVSVETIQVLIDSEADINHVDDEGKTPLHLLCVNGVSVETLQELINSGADINQIDYEGKTPLHWLCGNTSVSVETLQVLINSGAYINHIDFEGKTPLHWLCGNVVSVETLQVLLNSEADIKHVDEEGKTPLHWLCGNEGASVETLQVLKNCEADINHVDKKGKTPLHRMCRNESVSVETLQVLTNSEADINHVDKRGKTPLHQMCGNESVSVETLQVLINSETDICHVDNKGQTSLHWLCKNSNVTVETLQVLINSEADINHVDEKGRTPLHRMGGNQGVSVETLQVLIKSGADINHVDNEGKTPLHWLCRNKGASVETLQVLINSETDINHVDEKGRTPLHWMGGNQGVSVETLQVLIKSGADINHVDNEGKTPLHWLCGNYRVSVETLQVLINSETDICHVDNKGQTSLHWLCTNSNVTVEILQVLINSEADINHVDNEGKTPFHRMCGNDLVSVETLQVLIKNGADINHVDNKGKTPFHWMCGHQGVRVEILEVLIKSGADINHVDNEGKTPLHRLCGNYRVRVETLQVLINSEADINHVDKEGKTPLQRLCGNYRVRVETLQVLINSGADINHVDNERKLLSLCQCGNDISAFLRIMDSLDSASLNVNPDIMNVSIMNKPDEEGNTPFHCLADTCIKNHFFISRFITDRTFHSAVCETLSYFITNGADVYKRNHRGETPIDILKRWRRYD